MAAFKVPEHLPQDLLLISEFVNVQAERPLPPSLAQDNDDDIASSGSEIESEEEIEKDLIALEDDEEKDGKPLTSDSSSSSESDSSDSDSDSEVEDKKGAPEPELPTPGDDDDEATVPAAAAAYLQTKNEIVDAVITIPELDRVETDEELEKVGEVLSVIDDVVIVKGLPSEFTNRGSERALDSDTLLVFGDRKVMGYIYETFGPTSQPFYQIKFNQAYPLNLDKIQIGREVFHVPSRSHFIFVNQLKHFKGSDASNVHDEEPGEDEIEFSDDEAEAMYRNRLKHKRGRDRTSSVSSSRHSTPAPSQMRDQDMMTASVLNKSAFDEHGPYDLDYGAGPSRPAPKPYDDPYSSASTSTGMAIGHSSRMDDERGRSKDSRFSRSSEGRSRGRGRGRGKRVNNHLRGPHGRGGVHPQTNNMTGGGAEGYDPRMPQESLPSPSMQGQTNHAFNYDPNTNAGASWVDHNQSFGQLQNQQSFMFTGPSYQSPYAQPSTFIQPHINPRFASAFGFQMTSNTAGYAQGSPGVASISPVEPTTPQDQDWSEQWTVPTTAPADPKEGPNP